jgi:hypothetical protein
MATRTPAGGFLPQPRAPRRPERRPRLRRVRTPLRGGGAQDRAHARRGHVRDRPRVVVGARDRARARLAGAVRLPVRVDRGRRRSDGASDPRPVRGRRRPRRALRPAGRAGSSTPAAGRAHGRRGVGRPGRGRGRPSPRGLVRQGIVRLHERRRCRGAPRTWRVAWVRSRRLQECDLASHSCAAAARGGRTGGRRDVEPEGWRGAPLAAEPSRGGPLRRVRPACLGLLPHRSRVQARHHSPQEGAGRPRPAGAAVRTRGRRARARVESGPLGRPSPRPASGAAS